MIRRLLIATLTIGLLVAALPASAAAGGGMVDYPWGTGPNQGEMSKILLVDGPGDCCPAVPGAKVENGDLGRYEKVYSNYPIAFVSVKSGKDAEVLWSYSGHTCGKYWVKFFLSKDISNYVVWTCPCGANNSN